MRREHITLREYALTDPLTGIPNRRAMELELKRSLANADRAGSMIHLAFIDLDDFKSINDDYGHDAGDRFLIEMARKIRAGLREGDFIARIGGDEFVVFGSAVSEAYSDSRKAIQKRIEDFSKGTFHLGVADIDYEGASVGVVTSEPRMKEPEALLSLADEAMYRVKKARRREQLETDF
ncbi:GGDEF domain-containing protein [Marinobacter sp.]|uniref:GGDEF domain-containing protein n=2 Tax=Marinobacter sp. TaxID=50741 RepID=UPI00356176C2